jgi:phosphate butyryltransferase
VITTFDQILTVAKEKGPKRIAIAAAHDPDALAAYKVALEAGIVTGALVGDGDKIRAIADEIGLDLSTSDVIDLPDMAEASAKAVTLVSSGEADIVMKGLVDTSIILKAVLNKETGLRTGNVLSHVAVFDVPTYHKILMVTDAAMNIAPSLEQKAQIIENALDVARGLEIDEPNVGAVCAKEKVNPKMQATVDAGELVKMAEEGKITGCKVGGPFALDNAVNKEAAKTKGIKDPMAGDVDILLMDDIESGNVLYKALSFLAGAKSAGVIVGATAPVVLTSRADSDETKLNSIALGVLMSAAAKK